MRIGTLMAIPFDVERLEVRGTPVAILENLMQAVLAPDTDDETGAGQFTVSANGTLAYLEGGIYPPRRSELAWVDSKGVATVLPIPPGDYLAPRVSPDGRRAAYFRTRRPTREADIWVYDFDRQNSTRLTLQGDNAWVAWAPDSKSLVFSTWVANVGNLARIPADGSGEVERLTASKYTQMPASWSRPLNVLAFLESHDRLDQVWVLPMERDSTTKPFLRGPFPLSYPAFSPDGRWLAYVSAESGANEVYVQPYPGPGEKIRISPDGGHSPVWGPTQRELFYLREGHLLKQMMVVEINGTADFRSGKPRLLFEGPYGSTNPLRGYDIAPDGRRFLMTRPGTPEPPLRQMHIILNWTEELKRLVPTN
jgi:serine/threonine-protein kinase